MIVTFNDILFYSCDSVEDNGNTFTMISGDFRCQFTSDTHKYYDVEVPSEVEPMKYCYTAEDGFFLNPNYEEPNAYGIPNEVYNSILDDYTNELIESGVL